MNTPALRVEARRSLAEATPLAGALDALNLASRRPSPFDTFAYLEAFVGHDEHRTPGEEALLLFAFEGDRLLGFLPLRKVPERLWGIPYTSVRFLVSHDNDRPRLVCRPEDEERCAKAFYRYLFERERGFSLLLLNEQDAASKLLSPDVDPRRYFVRRFPNNPNGTIELHFQSLAEYLRSFGKTHRRNMERVVERLVGAGDLELCSTSDPAALPAFFDLYLALDRRSWKAKVGGHIGRHPDRVAFFRKLLAPGQPMKILIHLLLLDGVPIAGFLLGGFEDRLYGLEIAFDEGYRRFSPGNAALLLTIGDAIARGYRSINLLGNYAYYKSRWHATITPTDAVQVYRVGSLVHLKALGGEIWRRFHPPISQQDVAFNLERKDAGEADDGAGPLPDRAVERAHATRALSETKGVVTRLRGPAISRLIARQPDKAHAARLS